MATDPAHATRCRGRDGAYLRQCIDTRTKTSARIDFREDMCGDMKEQALRRWRDFIIDIRKQMTNVNKIVADEAFDEKAKYMEHEWHLAGERSEWKAAMSARTRAMLRDVQEGVRKAKGKPGKKAPNWVLPFLATH